ncbi:MAG: hypothetical protein AB1631_04780 [Acidobacteriota bacterium]
MISQPLSVLFDKGVVRRVYEAQVRRAQGRLPTLLQMEAVEAFARLRTPNNRLYITEESANVLQLRQPRFAKLILNDTKAIRKGRYLRRWARRLRDFAFSREDAVVLAYGSFGLEIDSQSIGVEVIVSGDLGLVTNFNTRSAEIKERFDQMALNLPLPYRSLSLPKVVTPATVLTDW